MQTPSLVAIGVLAACASSPAPAPAHERAAAPAPAHDHDDHRVTDAEHWAKIFDDPARDAWQRPDDVVAALALAPEMTVADVGAGTGYFTMRLARAVPEGSVLATDIEPDMVRYLGERARREHLDNVRAVLSAPDDPRLAPASVDRILIVDTWHHVGGRVAFAKKLAAALRPGGTIAIVDFTMESPHGPPRHHRLAPAAVIAELGEAGLVAELLQTQLPDQYIVVARR